MAEIEWIKIEKNQPLKKGDRVRLYFDAHVSNVTVLSAQVAYVEWKVENNADFKILKHSIPNNLEMYWEVEVLHDSPVTVAIILMAISSVLISVWLNFREARLRAEAGVDVGGTIKETIEETGWTALKIAGAAIIGVIALKWLKA